MDLDGVMGGVPRGEQDVWGEGRDRQGAAEDLLSRAPQADKVACP